MSTLENEMTKTSNSVSNPDNKQEGGSLADEKALAEEKTPVEEKAPTEEKIPTEEKAPVDGKAPVDEKVPAEEKTPADGRNDNAESNTENVKTSNAEKPIITADGTKMRVYLDNCCFNRPYDDQSYMSISLEAQAKLHVQDLIRKGRLEMASSYMLEYENGQNPYEMRRTAITEFIDDNTTIYVSNAKLDDVSKQAKIIMETGVKYKDACHVVCATMTECDYFLTTDRRLLKYQTDKLKMMNPIDFVRELEE